MKQQHPDSSLSPKSGDELVDQTKSSNFPDWDEYFQSLAVVVAIKSKDEDRKVGAVIVSPDRIVLSTGFNGLARGVYDAPEILKNKEVKLAVICHAEANAVFNAVRAGISLIGSTIYVTTFPCLSCCNIIIQAGVKRIYTHAKEFWKNDPLDGEKETEENKQVNNSPSGEHSKPQGSGAGTSEGDVSGVGSKQNGEADKYPPHYWKKKILKQAEIEVVAPFHPDFPPYHRPNGIIDVASLCAQINEQSEADYQ